MTQEDIYYEAILSRDFRFDGKFFAGSKTTWIYCRPICPAKPKRKNVVFFETAIQAERAGYRPCMRCRPESAPSSPVWLGKSNTVRRGLKILMGSGYYGFNEVSFASNLGVSSRHLRRLFIEETGKTAKQIADDNRLDFARKLITETALPISKIAYTSGFSSIRRFNDSVKKRFSRPPSELRKSKKGDYQRNTAITLNLSYRPPFSWEDHLRFYRSHAITGVEKISSRVYSRSFRNFGASGFVQIYDLPEKNSLIVSVSADDMSCLYPLMQNIRLMFDLNADPVVIANTLEKHKDVSRFVKYYPGLRISRFWDPFEGAVCTILGQLVSLQHARNLVEKLVSNYGETSEYGESGEKGKLFPSAQTLSSAKLEDIGTTKIRARAINEMSKMILEGELSFNPSSDSALRSKLMSIRGIGPWTADYIALRAMGEPDSFPDDDLVLKRCLKKYSNINPEEFSPYRSYLAAYLWHDHVLNSSKKGNSK